MFFVLNGLLNGEYKQRAIRKFSESPAEELNDGWYVAPTSSVDGSLVLTSARGPYKNSKEASAAVEFLEPYPDASVATLIDIYCSRHKIDAQEHHERESILLTLLTELIEIDAVPKSVVVSRLEEWGERQAEPDAVDEYIS
jgi:hypothetical protein